MSRQVIRWHEYAIDSLIFRLYSVPIQVGSVVTAVQLGDYGLPIGLVKQVLIWARYGVKRSLDNI